MRRRKNSRIRIALLPSHLQIQEQQCRRSECRADHAEECCAGAAGKGKFITRLVFKLNSCDCIYFSVIGETLNIRTGPVFRTKFARAIRFVSEIEPMFCGVQPISRGRLYLLYIVERMIMNDNALGFIGLEGKQSVGIRYARGDQTAGLII